MSLIWLQWLLLGIAFRICTWRWLTLGCEGLVVHTWSYSRVTLNRIEEMLGTLPGTERIRSRGRKREKHMPHICCTSGRFFSWWVSQKLHFVLFPYKKEDCSIFLCNRFSQFTLQNYGVVWLSRLSPYILLFTFGFPVSSTLVIAKEIPTTSQCTRCDTLPAGVVGLIYALSTLTPGKNKTAKDAERFQGRL